MRIPTLRRMSPGTARGALLALALSLAGATELRAQGLSATSARDLGFGSVLPGVPTTVHPTDLVRSGQFEITGPPDAAIQITFFLPLMLIGPGDATMPVSFGETSAGFSPSGSISSQDFFDPKLPKRVNLSPTGRGTCFIGGVLTPSGTQPAGSYSGSITITVAPLDI